MIPEIPKSLDAPEANENLAAGCSIRQAEYPFAKIIRPVNARADLVLDPSWFTFHRRDRKNEEGFILSLPSADVAYIQPERGSGEPANPG